MDSSSTSAQADGEAFVKDPLWTLLSRMGIIPWLAEWLSSCPGQLPRSPPEFWWRHVASYILLIQPSPDAATAAFHVR